MTPLWKAPTTGLRQRSKAVMPSWEAKQVQTFKKWPFGKLVINRLVWMSLYMDVNFFYELLGIKHRKLVWINHVVRWLFPIFQVVHVWLPNWYILNYIRSKVQKWKYDRARHPNQLGILLLSYHCVIGPSKCLLYSKSCKPKFGTVNVNSKGVPRFLAWHLVITGSIRMVLRLRSTEASCLKAPPISSLDEKRNYDYKIWYGYDYSIDVCVCHFKLFPRSLWNIVLYNCFSSFINDILKSLNANSVFAFPKSSDWSMTGRSGQRTIHNWPTVLNESGNETIGDNKTPRLHWFQWSKLSFILFILVQR